MNDRPASRQVSTVVDFPDPPFPVSKTAPSLILKKMPVYQLKLGKDKAGTINIIKNLIHKTESTLEEC